MKKSFVVFAVLLAVVVMAADNTNGQKYMSAKEYFISRCLDCGLDTAYQMVIDTVVTVEIDPAKEIVIDRGPGTQFPVSVVRQDRKWTAKVTIIHFQGRQVFLDDVLKSLSENGYRPATIEEVAAMSPLNISNCSTDVIALATVNIRLADYALFYDFAQITWWTNGSKYLSARQGWSEFGSGEYFAAIKIR